MYKIGIIGTGKIGSQLAYGLINSQIASEIRLSNRSTNKLHGEIISLALCSHVVGSSTVVSEIDWKEINDLDLLVICIKDAYDPRSILGNETLPEWLPHNLRCVGLLRDLPLIKAIASKIATYNKAVAVITNPVEVISFFVSQWVPDSTVFGLGASLDGARASYVLSKQTSRIIEKDACVVAGEHGNQLVAVSSLWQAHPELHKLSADIVTGCLDKTAKLGFDIVSKLGFTLFDCAPVFVDDIKWLMGEQEVDFRSFSVPRTGRLYSQPIRLRRSTMEEFVPYTADETCRLNAIQLSLHNLTNALAREIE